jgi:GNAT superfamily N-acetyltransferase
MTRYDANCLRKGVCLMFDSRPKATSAGNLPVRRIRFWQHGRAVRQMVRAYPPGVDTVVDHIRAQGFLVRFALQRLLIPLYFTRDQGWVIPGVRGEMAAIMYLRRQRRQGIRVMHIDDINVDPGSRRRGLAQRLLQLAEELARHEQRPFLKLAVTVANTPAVTLYRRLGYQDQHHHYFTYRLAPAAKSIPTATSDVNLRPLRRRPAREACQRYSQMELQESASAVAELAELAKLAELAELMAVYYPDGARGSSARRYAIGYRGQPIGYGDVVRRGSQCHLLLSLRPDVWSTDIERQAIQRLTSAVLSASGEGHQDDTTTFALHVPSAAHFDALCAGSPSLASELGFVEQSFERMIMAKVVASAP